MIVIWAAFLAGMIVGACATVLSLILLLLAQALKTKKQAPFIRDWGTLEDLAPKEKP